MISGVVKINVSRRPMDQSEGEYGARKIVLAEDALSPSGNRGGVPEVPNRPEPLRTYEKIRKRRTRAGKPYGKAHARAHPRSGL